MLFTRFCYHISFMYVLLVSPVAFNFLTECTSWKSNKNCQKYWVQTAPSKLVTPDTFSLIKNIYREWISFKPFELWFLIGKRRSFNLIIFRYLCAVWHTKSVIIRDGEHMPSFLMFQIQKLGENRLFEEKQNVFSRKWLMVGILIFFVIWPCSYCTNCL